MVDASACQYLAQQPAFSANKPAFLLSFPTETDGPLNQSAFLYDNAVAAIALVGCGETAKAKRITDAIIFAQSNDRYWHDGRLRNAYRGGAVETPVKLPGWWDGQKNQWLEDRYQVGSDVGNMAWALLSLLAVDRGLNDPAYRKAALSLAEWIERFHDQRGKGAYKGGLFAHEPTPESVEWKSTEHNTDLVAVFRALGAATGEKKWIQRAEENTAFVASLWNGEKKVFATGVGDDGVSVNPIVALDAQIWPLLAIPGFHSRYIGAVDGAKQFTGFEEGFAYSEAKEGIWTEGTAQVLLLYRLLGWNTQAAALQRVIQQQRAPQGGYFAASNSSIPTSFMLATDPTKPRLYFKLPHLGALAWVALAERGFNPFTFSASLP
ncbi:MAG TPA: hypothetical protein VFM46_20115 [Pseudomonadales bacterium]|nr:hypothetical protein [Pseudomonadales bacterium]